MLAMMNATPSATRAGPSCRATACEANAGSPAARVARATAAHSDAIHGRSGGTSVYASGSSPPPDPRTRRAVPDAK